MMNKIVDPRFHLLNMINEIVLFVQGNCIDYLSALSDNNIILLGIDNFSANPSTSTNVLSRMIAGNKKNTDNKREKYFFNRIQAF